MGTNFFWTAVHEIGHALGVVHSTYWDAIMYPYYTGYKENLKLHEDDIMAIQAKYGKCFSHCCIKNFKQKFISQETRTKHGV